MSPMKILKMHAVNVSDAVPPSCLEEDDDWGQEAVFWMEGVAVPLVALLGIIGQCGVWSVEC